MESVWLVNGERREVPPSDRGLAYGDGLFETMAVVNGRIRLLDYHFERLESGCRRLHIPPIAREVLRGDLDRLLPGAERCVAKIIVTRGSSGRGYRPPVDPVPLRVVSASPWPDYPAERYETGVEVIRCSTTLGENEALAGLKHLCRLEQVLAQIEVQRAGAVEGIMCTRRGDVIGGTMSNIFVVSAHDTLMTPSLTTCGVAGVMRRAVMERAVALGAGVETGQLTYSMLTQAKEIFLTNSVFGVWPVRAVGETRFPIGALTRRLMDSLAESPGSAPGKAEDEGITR
jgi:4-amino-4-deoxychorismate lyase